MKVVFSSVDGSRIVPLEMDAGQGVEDAKALLEVEMGIPMVQQAFFMNNARVPTHGTLASVGIGDGAVLVVARDPRPILQSIEGRVASDYRGLTWNDIPSMPPPEVTQLMFDANPGMLADLEYSNPKLAEAFRSRDLQNVRDVTMRQQLDRMEREASARARESNLRRRLEANPMDVDAQRELEELIRKANVARNYEMAVEHMPESFADVSMLYIDTKVNGVPVKAFVDSGAQITIMSPECAERCGIMRLVDKRFDGQVVGVGTAKIIGRVHMSPLQIGDKYFNCTFTVMESNGPKSTDLLFGLDMLKRFQSEIDLNKMELRLRCEGVVVAVPFLGEGVRATQGAKALRSPRAQEMPKDAFRRSASPSHGGGSAASGSAASAAPGDDQGRAAAPGGEQSGAGAPVADEDAKVAQLRDMGIPVDQARAALRRTGGNVDLAASFFLQ